MGQVARSDVYTDAKDQVRMITLFILLPDGKSVLALDIRVGDIQIDWQEGSDVFPGTATVIDRHGEMVLHQQIGQEHILCELEDFTSQDYLKLIGEFEGKRGVFQRQGQKDTYQDYYAVDDDGTFIVTIPQTVITKDATFLFYAQIGLIAIFLVAVLILSVQNYRRSLHGQKSLNCFEALGQTYYCVVLANPAQNSCEIVKLDLKEAAPWRHLKVYTQLVDRMAATAHHSDAADRLRQEFAASELSRLCRCERDRCYLEYQRDFADGERWVSAEAFAVPHDQNGQVILAFRLIDAAKTAQLEHNRALQESLTSARNAALAKNDFLSRMSHDMRTPMNAVLGFTDMARRSLNDPEKCASAWTR